MATNAAKLTELQTELALVKTQLATARAGGQSFSVDGLSKTAWNINDLRREQTRLEKSIQRLLRGGRGFAIDLSYPASSSDDSTDNTVYTVVPS
jgi:hypothetical protein